MKQLSITLLVIFLPLISMGQSTSNNKTFEVIDNVKYLASYDYICQEDSTSNSLLKFTVMSLYIGSNFSKFEHSGVYLIDSLWIHSKLERRAKTEQIINLAKGNLRHALAQYHIVKNNNSTQINLYERVSSQYYQINENINFDWILEQKRDTLIAGYICKEARTEFRGRKYKAWYSLSIPISEGPYKFKGLPGLIIKLEDTKKQHCFELSAFNKISYGKPIYLHNRNYKKIDAKDYPKLKHNEALNRSNNINKQVINLSSENMGTIEAKILRRNNIIERF